MAPTYQPQQKAPVDLEDEFEAIAEALANEDYKKCLKTADAGVRIASVNGRKTSRRRCTPVSLDDGSLSGAERASGSVSAGNSAPASALSRLRP